MNCHPLAVNAPATSTGAFTTPAAAGARSTSRAAGAAFDASTSMFW
jgi:hypothetical protein